MPLTSPGWRHGIVIHADTNQKLSPWQRCADTMGYFSPTYFTISQRNLLKGFVCGECTLCIQMYFTMHDVQNTNMKSVGNFTEQHVLFNTRTMYTDHAGNIV